MECIKEMRGREGKAENKGTSEGGKERGRKNNDLGPLVRTVFSFSPLLFFYTNPNSKTRLARKKRIFGRRMLTTTPQCRGAPLHTCLACSLYSTNTHTASVGAGTLSGGYQYRLLIRKIHSTHRFPLAKLSWGSQPPPPLEADMAERARKRGRRPPESFQVVVHSKGRARGSTRGRDRGRGRSGIRNRGSRGRDELEVEGCKVCRSKHHETGSEECRYVCPFCNKRADHYRSYCTYRCGICQLVANHLAKDCPEGGPTSRRPQVNILRGGEGIGQEREG